MRPSQALQFHRAAIRCVVAAHRACNARVFGSVIHGLDTEGSDLDIIVDPTPEASLMDVLTPKALPEAFRSAVLAQAQAI